MIGGIPIGFAQPLVLLGLQVHEIRLGRLGDRLLVGLGGVGLVVVDSQAFTVLGHPGDDGPLDRARRLLEPEVVEALIRTIGMPGRD